jgi:hypothetical protein
MQLLRPEADFEAADLASAVLDSEVAAMETRLACRLRSIRP